MNSWWEGCGLSAILEVAVNNRGFGKGFGAVFFFAFFSFALICSTPSPASSAGSFGAQIADFSGDVFVVYKGMPGKSPAKKDLKLVPGDAVETGKGAEAEILYEDGNLTRLDEGSRMVIEKLDVLEGASRETVIKLDAGRIKNAVSKLVDKRSKFEVHTPSAVAGVTGTPPWVVALTGTGPNPATEVDLLGKAGESGQVFVNNPAGKQLLSPGMRSVCELGKPPVNPFSISPDRLQLLESKMKLHTPDTVRNKFRDDLDTRTGAPKRQEEKKEEKKPDQPEKKDGTDATKVPDAPGVGGLAGALATPAGAGLAAGVAIGAASSLLSGGGDDEKAKEEKAKEEKAKKEEQKAAAQLAAQAAMQAVGQAGGEDRSSVTAMTIAGAVHAIAGGARHSLMVKPDGTALAWGYNDDGQLGDNDDDDQEAPVYVRAIGGIGKLDGVLAVAAGDRHSLALKKDGTVLAWGYNNDGQLGDGTDDDTESPVAVLKVKKTKEKLQGIISIAAGTMHSVAVRNDGTVWAWGENNEGQLGDGTGDESEIPVQIKGLAGVIAVAAHSNHSLALKSDGTVWGWGKNKDGQLGDRTISNRETPVQVKGPEGKGKLENVVAIATGDGFSMALKKDGTVWTWGNNKFGQLGIGSDAPRLVPVQVESLTNITAIAAGAVHALALHKDGTVWAWGNNDNGRLGDDSTTDHRSPVRVILALKKDKIPFAGVTAIAAGGAHSLAIIKDGTAWAWGKGNDGQLGDGEEDTSETPVKVKLP